jgi:hypothetical protein
VKGIIALAAIVLIPVAAYAAKGPDEFPVTVIARFEDGRPAPGALCSAAGASNVRTGADGRATFRIYGSDGEQARLEIKPPEGYRLAPKADLDVPLRRGIPLGGGDEQPIPVSREITFAPKLRTYAIMVRTDGRSGLPVETYGKAMAATNEQGVAIFTYKGVPGTELEVRLLTAGQVNLKPANPRRTFTLPDHDDAFVFRQAFKEEDVRMVRKPARSGATPAVGAPPRSGPGAFQRKPKRTGGEEGGDDPPAEKKPAAPADEGKGPMRL